jgi:hypothetical protein
MAGIEDLMGEYGVEGLGLWGKYAPKFLGGASSKKVDAWSQTKSALKRIQEIDSQLEKISGMGDAAEGAYGQQGLKDMISELNQEKNALEGTIDLWTTHQDEKWATGGRVGYQTGGITQSQILQPDWIEALGKTYAADLTRQAGIPAITQATQQMPGETASQFAQRQAQAQQFDITQQSMGLLAPQVAAQDPMQAAAYTQATDPTYGLAAYQPYTADARAAAQAAGALTGPMTTQQLTDYMSPYQQQVIDATMADYDAQAAKSRLALGAPEVAGVFGGGRHGIAEAEFDALSNRGRAAQLADLRQRGFQQAQAGRQQDFANQQALATQQAGLGTQALGNVQRQIAGLGTLGATQQAQNQAVLDAQRQFAQMAVQEPTTRLGMLGTGVTGLMGGTQGLGTTIGQAPPQTSPLGTALGIGSTLAGIYGYMNK